LFSLAAHLLLLFLLFPYPLTELILISIHHKMYTYHLLQASFVAFFCSSIQICSCSFLGGEPTHAHLWTHPHHHLQFLFQTLCKIGVFFTYSTTRHTLYTCPCLLHTIPLIF
jgi:hypothetical protein